MKPPSLPENPASAVTKIPRFLLIFNRRHGWLPAMPAIESGVFSRGTGTRRDAAPKVALLIETSNRYGRDLLYGVRDWLHRSGESWAIRFTEQARRAPLPSWLRDWHGHGIIARVDSPQSAKALARLGLPIVDVSAERFASPFPRVSIDNRAVARLAAEHLTQKGFVQFGFCGDARFLWSRQRGEEFARAVGSAGHRCAEFDGHARPGSDAESRALAKWLRQLPKPVGVFACYDARAQQVLEACQLARLQVPDEVAVLGVDNDEVLCELCSPPLSSVLPNARRIGFEAAELLARMMRSVARASRPWKGGRTASMGETPLRRHGQDARATVKPRQNGKTCASATHYVEPVRVVERQSTDIVSVTDPRLAAALRFIRQHACEGIRVSDVLKAVPMSRTLFERKFKATLGHSPHRQIVHQKIERAKQLLVESEVSIAVVAELAGFDNASYLSVAFRRETGESPYAFRARQRTR